MICSKCGLEIDSGAVFCGNCGQPVQFPEQAAAQRAGLAQAPFARPGGGKAIAAFVLGVIGLVGWLRPIVGLILGILALVFGTMTTRSAHRNLAITGIVLGSLTILMSLGAFIYTVQQITKQQAAANTGYSTSVEALNIASKEVVTALTTSRAAY